MYEQNEDIKKDIDTIKKYQTEIFWRWTLQLKGKFTREIQYQIYQAEERINEL